MKRDLIFLSLDFIVKEENQSIDVDVDYDKRVIKDGDKLKQITEEYFGKVEDLMFKEVKEN